MQRTCTSKVSRDIVCECVFLCVCMCVSVWVCTDTLCVMTYFPLSTLSSLQAHTHHLHTQWQSSGSSEVATLLRWMLHLLGVLVFCRNDSRTSKVDQVIQVMWGGGGGRGLMGKVWHSGWPKFVCTTYTLQLGPMVPVAV